MNAAVVLDPRTFRLERSIGWWDEGTDCQFVFSQPSTDPELWSRYAEGAFRSYRAFGVESVLDHEAMTTGRDTVMFFVALDSAGEILAGVRAVGPLLSPDDSHAVAEWAGQPHQQLVSSTIAQCLPLGIMELKSAWTVGASGRGRALSDVIVRACIHMGALLDAQFLMATAASFIVAKWMTAGADLVPVDPAPYPDDRFQTQMVLWDRSNFAGKSSPDQASKLYFETGRLLHAFYRGVAR